MVLVNLVLKKYDIIEKLFYKVYEINSDERELSINLGKIAFYQQEFYISITNFMNSIKKHRQNWEGYLYISFAKNKIGDLEGCLEDLNKSKKIYSDLFTKDFLFALNNLEVEELINVHFNENNYEELERIFNFLYKQGKDINHLFERGKYKFLNKKFYDAISDFLELEKFEDMKKNSIMYLGRCKMELKDFKNAIVDFKRSLDLEENPAIRKYIETCKRMLNKND